jgi:hypothetical protein
MKYEITDNGVKKLIIADYAFVDKHFPKKFKEIVEIAPVVVEAKVDKLAEIETKIDNIAKVIATILEYQKP